MDKKMEKMRTDMHSRLQKGWAFAAFLVILIVVSVSRIIPVQLPNPDMSDFVTGFQVGLLAGLLAVALVHIFRMQKAMKDDAALRKLYYSEHDERNCYIQQKVGQTMLAVTPAILLVAAVIAGYFSVTVFFSLIAATLLQSLVGLGLKFYYHSRFSATEE